MLSPSHIFSQAIYRKRPCISRTFFHKIEAKNQGCGLSTGTSVFGVLKNLINILNKRKLERVAVVQ